MAAQSSIVVLPTTDVLPETIDISCSGLDNTKEIELLINEVVRHTVAVDSEGNVNSSYNIPVGPIQDSLIDMGAASSTLQNKNIIILCDIKTGLNDSMQLRYKA